VTWWDYNEDGWPDLYVGNDFQDADRLYRNNGDGTFSDVIEKMVPHTTWFSMGADFADLDGDGAVDFVIADMSGTNHFKQKTAMGAMSESAEFLNTAVPRQYMRNVVYLNSRGGRFREAAYLAGLANSDWTWSVRLADFDNDGRADVFFTNGMARNLNVADNEAADNVLPGETEWDKHIRANTAPLREQNLAFRNLGDLRFVDVSKQWGLDHVGMSYAAATADLDRDGDLDLVVANLEEPVSIYRNDSAAGHRLLIRLVGTTSNRWGIGSKVRIETASGLQVRELTPVRGYMASNEPLVHFGLGEDETIKRLTVRWPSGHVQTFEDLAVDRFYTIAEPAGPPPEPPSSEPAPAMFRRSEALADVKHNEQPYDDFKRQPLLPNKYSQLGPGMAWGDIDGDGDDDLWIGGAKGQSGRLYRNDGEGKFTFTSFDPWFDDSLYEDMAGVWLDAEGDGDLDLYVVSGGVECEPGDKLLQDRLYLNDGKGRFSKAPEGALPEMRDSGGVVVAADFDRDGDLDLFVGGRVIPGKYPLSPHSRLLRNDGGRFTDATAELAPALQQTGLVTGAVWSDADGDGWVDLLVTHEWGPVKLFHNDRGRLVDKTMEAGLAKRLGWWNGIAAADVDNDGDIDYAVTNFGLNTKYHASPKRPTLLYYGDFDKRGIMTIVEAEYENETLFPVRGKSCSTHAMPHLAGKFTTFKAFALADLAKIYTPKCLSESHRFEANMLESGVLINDGVGRFSFRPLPRLAQIAPGFGVVLTDVDGDGNVDLYMVQNFYGPQAETGRMAGGVSLLLRGRGDGSFVAVPPRESGLIVPGDAKSLTTTDLDGDGRVDFVVGVNDDKLLAFERDTSSGNGRVLSVKLRGLAGNPQAVGARVKLIRSDEVAQIAEVHAGSGYLSQSSTTITFGLGDSTAERIEVTWPDGKRTTHTPTSGSETMTIQQPDS
ncbi:MAG: VCBS repeat-containing protein, partial [Planctomycetes bacterium]|nr:VCBS repeat-containing protein [Planctomycetota bacterium]